MSDTTIQKIREHILEGSPLTEKQTELFERYKSVFRLLSKHKIKSVVVKKLKALDATRERSSILRDIKAAEKLFCEVEKYEKEFLRMMVVEDAMQDIQMYKKLIKTELKKGAKTNYNVVEILQKLKADATKNLINSAGLKETDMEMPNFAKLENHTYQINIDSTTQNLMQLLEQNMRGGAFDLTRVFNDQILDLEIEDDERRILGTD